MVPSGSLQRVGGVAATILAMVAGVWLDIRLRLHTWGE